MNTLIPLTKADKKKLGIVDSKNGLMIDKKRLVELKRMQTPKPKEPVVKKVKAEEVVKQVVKSKDEQMGIY